MVAMMRTRCSRVVLFLSIFTSLSLLACGGGSGGGSSDSGSPTIFDGTSACSSIGLKSSFKVVNGERCPRTGASDTTSVVKVELLVAGFTAGVCTGTVIAPTAVLTAAHCLQGAQGAVVVTTANGQSTAIPARSLTVHPGFGLSSGNYYVNDVAIIRTAKPLNAPRAPILISRSARQGEEALVAGFGKTGPDDSSTGDIYAGRAVVSSVTDNHVRIDFTSDEAHPCFGDSGGALFVKEATGLAIVGVVSQSDPSVAEDNICRVGDKTLYTNMDKNSVSSFVLSVVPEAATS